MSSEQNKIFEIPNDEHLSLRFFGTFTIKDLSEMDALIPSPVIGDICLINMVIETELNGVKREEIEQKLASFDGENWVMVEIYDPTLPDYINAGDFENFWRDIYDSNSAGSV